MLLLAAFLFHWPNALSLNAARFLFTTDIPAQVPPLTPGTNKKMTEALKASFASWEKEQERLGIPKGESVDAAKKATGA